MTDHIEIELVTPLSAAFTKPVAAEILGNICKEKNIKVTPNEERPLGRKGFENYVEKSAASSNAGIACGIKEKGPWGGILLGENGKLPGEAACQTHKV